MMKEKEMEKLEVCYSVTVLNTSHTVSLSPVLSKYLTHCLSEPCVKYLTLSQ